MEILDDVEQLDHLDPNNIRMHLDEFADQLESGWREAIKFTIPTGLVHTQKVALVGVGDTGVVGGIIRTLAERSSPIPIINLRSYQLPAFIDSKTLVIGVSYSGNSDETVEAINQAVKLGAKVITISTGGDLASLARKHRAPHITITYGAEGRMAVPFLTALVLGIFKRLGFIQMGASEFEKVVRYTRLQHKQLSISSGTKNNLAKQIARQIGEKIVYVVSNGTLTPIANRLALNINQNVRQVAVSGSLPEFSHNGLSGLDRPKRLSEQIFFLILESLYDHPRIKVHISVLVDNLARRLIKHESILIPNAKTAITESILALQLVDYIGFYLAIENKQIIQELKTAQELKDRLKFQRNKGNKGGKWKSRT